jgi:N-acetylmuramic acid 6-phosphate etherase
MVDLQPTNNKLRDRTVRILCELTDLPREEATRALDEASGELKVALLMQLSQIDATEARHRLEAHGGLMKSAMHAQGGQG